MPAQYDLTQTAFMFSFFVNAASAVQGTSAQLAQFLDKVLSTGGTWSAGKNSYTINGLIQQQGSQLIGSDWQIGWGPAIFRPSTSGYPDNAMAVLYSPSQDTYVVAIAGTDPNSPYDWLFEDLKVGPNAMVNFPITNFSAAPTGGAANAGTAQITLGTALGVYNLLQNMIDQDGNTASLVSYLSGLVPVKSTAKIIFVGHSLGGALSATLPLQLLSMIKNWGWTAKGGGVYAMPTAGPTPGNAAFAAMWNKQFPATPVQNTASGNQVTSLNVPIANSRDVVPHAWTNIYAKTQVPQSPVYFYDYQEKLFQGTTTLQTLTVTLANVPNSLNKLATEIYAVATKASTNGAGAGAATLGALTWLSDTSPITYWNGTAFATYTLPTGNVTTLDAFKQVLGTIHVWQYFPFFGITTSTLPYPIVTTAKALASQETA